MRYRTTLTASALLVGLALTGCTSGSSPSKSTAAGTTSARTTSAAQPTSAAPSSTAQSTAATSTTPSATPTSKPAPLSAFENDPAVEAMRKFMYHAGRMINTGHYIDAEMRTMITPVMARGMKQLAGVDVGLVYPGPLPFQPKAVQVVNPTHRTVSGCLIVNGWAQNPKTHRSAKPVQVVGAKVFMVKVSGRWLVNALPYDTSVACKGVVVKTPTWSN